jgi:hypothetical protein
MLGGNGIGAFHDVQPHPFFCTAVSLVCVAGDAGETLQACGTGRKQGCSRFHSSLVQEHFLMLLPPEARQACHTLHCRGYQHCHMTPLGSRADADLATTAGLHG